MYGDDDQSAPPSAGLPPSDSAQALEVVELSNGQVIWSVVDAMRNDLGLDEEVASSAYQSRMSTTSDYSLRSPDEPRDNLQVFFREHKRIGSKGSTSSAMSRRKIFAANGNRPETKV